MLRPRLPGLCGRGILDLPALILSSGGVPASEQKCLLFADGTASVMCTSPTAWPQLALPRLRLIASTVRYPTRLHAQLSLQCVFALSRPVFSCVGAGTSLLKPSLSLAVRPLPSIRCLRPIPPLTPRQGIQRLKRHRWSLLFRTLSLRPGSRACLLMRSWNRRPCWPRPFTAGRRLHNRRLRLVWTSLLRLPVVGALDVPPRLMSCLVLCRVHLQTPELELWLPGMGMQQRAQGLAMLTGTFVLEPAQESTGVVNIVLTLRLQTSL